MPPKVPAARTAKQLDDAALAVFLERECHNLYPAGHIQGRKLQGVQPW